MVCLRHTQQNGATDGCVFAFFTFYKLSQFPNILTRIDDSTAFQHRPRNEKALKKDLGKNIESGINI